MTFNNAYLRITAFYVLIIMVISTIFSLALYRISSLEIDRSLTKQVRFIRNLPFRPSSIEEIEKLRNEQIAESNRKMITNLLLFNLFILFFSSFLSYYWAKKTMKPIEEILEAQSRFTADASHELRTPLTAMKTEIEVALRDKSLGINEAKNLLKSNLEEIGKLEYLSSTLLKLARLDEKDENYTETIFLKDIFNEAYKKVQRSAEKKKIAFQIKKTAAKIIGDKTSLIELMVILFDNAIKYSPLDKKVMVTTVQDNKSIKVIIKDHGYGIKVSDLPYIFNRFYRADISRSKEKTSGYGLGLSIAKKIIEVHNGKIEVESEPHKGSVFTITFKTI